MIDLVQSDADAAAADLAASFGLHCLFHTSIVFEFG